jgi:CysZ protein
MQIVSGIKYNLAGLKMGLKTPKLLFLGLLRFFVVIIVAIGLGAIILIYHTDIISAVWTKPETLWVVWIWYILSWLISLILIIFSSVLSYLLSQILFSIVIMDQMSRITERRSRGHVIETINLSHFSQLIYLIRQEIPRAIIPVFLLLILSVIGWLTPLGPFITIITSTIAAAFLAWDNTDLVPARRCDKYRSRFRFFIDNFSFHIGFGLLFLIPVINILCLSFAPIGATLYYLDKNEK